MNTCRKCGGQMVAGKALVNGLSGIPDFPGDTHICTVSPDPTKSKLIDCIKCIKCGWSVSNPRLNDVKTKD